MHIEAPVFPCGLSTRHTLVTIYWAITILQVHCCCSVAQSCLTLHDPMDLTISQSLPKFMSVSYGDVIQPSHPLLPSSSAFSLSQHQGLFQWVSCFYQVAKVLEFSFSISPSSEYSGMISSKIDWFELLAVQRTLKSLLQHHSWKPSILWCSPFFMVQIWQQCMTTGKTITFTRQTFVSKVMSAF